MPEDRLKRDYDTVENLGDLIRAREGRDSAFAQDVDSMEDIDVEALPEDPSAELTYPHHHGATEDQREGLDVDLMDTPHEKEVEFDWQDSVEEQLPTDPYPNEGMGEDDQIESLKDIDPNDLVGPVPSTDISAELSTDATKDEMEEYDLDDGVEECPHVQAPVELETAMDTDSDEFDFSIEDKFDSEVDHADAEWEFEQIKKAENEP